MPVSSVPLLDMHMMGRRRIAISPSSSRITRSPGSAVSATSARHSLMTYEVVDDREDPKAAAIAECIRYEVDAPTPVGGLRQGDRCPGAERALAAGPPPHLLT